MKNFLRKNNGNSKQGGYTLIEVILYSVLFVILLGAIINSTVLLMHSYQSIKGIKDVETSAISAMDRMTREIHLAQSVDGSGTTYNVPGGSLLLNTTDSNGNATTIKFYLSNGKVMLDKGGSAFGPLTLNSVNVSSLIFRPLTSSSSVGIKIEMIAGNATGTPVITDNFYNTAILRGSY